MLRSPWRWQRIALVVASCSYSPHYVSGVTRCADSPPLCPGGFVCDTAAGVCVTSLGGNDAGTDTNPGDARADHVADAGADSGAITDTNPGDTSPGDTRPPDAAVDAGCDANIATSGENCGACGHSCGGGMCSLGVCQSTTLAGVTAATSISVDATRIYFTSDTKILACPKSGCVLAPTQLDDMGMGGYSTWAVTVTNGNLFFMSAPTQPGTEHDDLFECPLTGCPSPAPIIGVAMPYGVNYLANAGDDVYWSDSQVNKTFRRACPANTGVCDASNPIVTVLNDSFPSGVLAGSAGLEFYFVNTLGLQKCPYAGCPGTPAVPTPTVLTSMIPTGVVAYGGLLYLQFGDVMHTLNGAIRTCTPVNCDAQTPKNFIANRDPISALTVDAQGVYWIEDANIYSCPRTGCIGGPRLLASGLVPTVTPSFNAHPIVTDDAFVYWIQDASGTVKRIAK